MCVVQPRRSAEKVEARGLIMWRWSVSMASRQSIDRFLGAQVVPRSALWRTEALRVVGWSASGWADVSERHDRYLEDAYLPPEGGRPRV